MNFMLHPSRGMYAMLSFTTYFVSVFRTLWLMYAVMNVSAAHMWLLMRRYEVFPRGLLFLAEIFFRFPFRIATDSGLPVRIPSIATRTIALLKTRVIRRRGFWETRREGDKTTWKSARMRSRHKSASRSTAFQAHTQTQEKPLDATPARSEFMRRRKTRGPGAP